VVRAFNDDRPYDQFILEQLAGDEVAPEDPSVFVATGFLRLGTYEYNRRDVDGQWSDVLNELTDVTGDAFLGLGLGCARCHDHKFDPILQRDYYRMRAFFAPLLWRDDRFLVRPEQEASWRAARARWNESTSALRARIAAVEQPFADQHRRDGIIKLPPAIQALLDKPIAQQTPLERQYWTLAVRQIDDDGEALDKRIKGEARARWLALQRELEATAGAPPEPPPRAFVATDVGPEAPPSFLAGDPARPVEPGFLTVLDTRAPAIEPVIGRDGQPTSTGRRTALARWIASPENPLTARVMVNRIWQQHFGRGLVATAGDFGHLGTPPSHPELLDWLAARFVAGGFRFKALHRLMVTSATYRQSAAHPRLGRAERVDPENRLLWHMRQRRLDAEQVRDALLAASGELDTAMGGPSVPADRPRRSVYTQIRRNSPDALLAAFDAADGFTSVATRNVTTTATQALYLMNDAWPLARARALAARVRAQAGGDAAAAVRLAFRLALGRAPDGRELRMAAAFLRAPGEDEALVDLCHALFNSNAFLHVE
jgi:hypothetical protein